jgi:hypothetical protein
MLRRVWKPVYDFNIFQNRSNFITFKMFNVQVLEAKFFAVFEFGLPFSSDVLYLQL